MGNGKRGEGDETSQAEVGADVGLGRAGHEHRGQRYGRSWELDMPVLVCIPAVQGVAEHPTSTNKHHRAHNSSFITHQQSMLRPVWRWTGGRRRRGPAAY